MSILFLHKFSILETLYIHDKIHHLLFFSKCLVIYIIRLAQKNCFHHLITNFSILAKWEAFKRFRKSKWKKIIYFHSHIIIGYNFSIYTREKTYFWKKMIFLFFFQKLASFFSLSLSFSSKNFVRMQNWWRFTHLSSIFSLAMIFLSPPSYSLSSSSFLSLCLLLLLASSHSTCTYVYIGDCNKLLVAISWQTLC